jgi:hypothetical protein
MRKASSYQSVALAIAERKRELGVTDEAVATARNSGTRRTREKRELLQRIQARARAAGVEPLPANF